MQVTKNFVGSRMNKSVDERLLKDGEYVDGLNIRVSSDESGEAGSVENSKGNEILTALQYNGASLSPDAVCIGAYEDGSNEVLYWFVTDPGVVDMIVSYNANTSTLVYHVISTSVLNFSDQAARNQRRINGINLIDDLLFFTDNRNPPRKINVTRDYPDPIAGVDQIAEDDISVIVAPPLAPPVLTTLQNASDENYMEDKFISFAYRYKYVDGEYSAISPFTDVAFVPGEYSVDFDSLDMLGMVNTINQANITFNTGTDNVIGVDVLFKETSSNIIKVIEKFNKADEGWADNTSQSINFDNRKIYTTLLESETLRLYDNVPLISKAQTVIGNRVMYGNYVDGYDIDTVMDYSLALVSEPVGTGTIPESTSDYTYLTDPTNPITNATIDIDFTGVELVRGMTIYIQVSFEHSRFSGATYPGSTLNEFQGTIPITLTRSFNSLSVFYNSLQFQNAIQGLNPPRDFADCNEGYSLTDRFNCSIVTEVGWTRFNSVMYQGFTTALVGNTIRIIPPVVTYSDDSLPSGSTNIAYEYFYNLAAIVTFRTVTNSISLHSDRDYEIGIVYMDDYGRASTVQVCKTNTVYIPKNTSDKQNKIELTIVNPPPTWATKYKPVIKESYAGYETIYSGSFFKNSSTGTWFLRLLGDNRQKVSEGDTLIVKRDSNGVNYQQPEVNILSLDTKEINFIDPNNSSGVIEPSGLYMEMSANNFTVQSDPLSLIWYGELSRESNASTGLTERTVKRQGLLVDNTDTIVDYYTYYGFDGTEFFGPGVSYPTYINTGVATPLNDRVFVEYELPIGTAVDFNIVYKRSGDDRFRWEFIRSYTAASTYSNFYDFIIGENIDFTQPTNDPDADSQTNTPEAFWDPAISTNPNVYNLPQINSLNFQYCRYLDTSYSPAKTESFLGVTTQGGTFGPNDASLSMNIQVRTSEGVLVFETEPDETNDIVYYENDQVFNIVSGFHQGNTQNQTGTQDAIISTDFFNCYTFGNGVESFKIKDSLAGMPLTIGSRPHAVADEDYKRAHRFSDITYSGVYNQESNINKLNEFNLALVNYKTLDRNYGPIEVMHSRLNDILVLQEDKISYVLANGKNLFSDATAGASIISTPEVLGQQVPRIEQYGISNNPESFAAYGPNVFFTDSKRNAVINLNGGSTGESLSVISMLGLRSWFRDLFKDNPNTIKLGGYDPYSDEYILSSYGDTPYTLSFSPSVNGWPSFYSFVPEVMIGMNSYLYSFNGGNLYRHNTNETRNNFYGVQYTSKITGVVNDEPSAVKVFKAMSLESNSPWDCTVTSDLSSGYMDSTWFSKKEGDYFAYIRRNANDDNLALRSAQGVGEATAINTAVATAITVSFGFNIDSIASVGDKLYRVVGGGGTNGLLGVITGIAGDTITIDGTTGVTLPLVGSYIFYVKDNVAESYGAIGYYMQYELENSSTNFVELFAVGTELFKSNP